MDKDADYSMHQLMNVGRKENMLKSFHRCTYIVYY